MTSTSYQGQLLGTVDVHELNTLRMGPLRQMIPRFVEEIELGRYLKSLLANTKNKAVQIQPHQDADGRRSTHVFDVVLLN